MAAPGTDTASSPAPAKRRTKRTRPKWLGGLIGIVGLLVVWEIVGLMQGKNGGIPAPTEIVSQMIDDGWSFYWANASVTLHEAMMGYIYGNLLAIGLAFLVLIVPLLEKPDDAARHRVVLHPDHRHRTHPADHLRR